MAMSSHTLHTCVFNQFTGSLVSHHRTASTPISLTQFSVYSTLRFELLSLPCTHLVVSPPIASPLLPDPCHCRVFLSLSTLAAPRKSPLVLPLLVADDSWSHLGAGFTEWEYACWARIFCTKDKGCSSFGLQISSCTCLRLHGQRGEC